MTIRILIADDHALLREGLKKVINISPDLVLAGEATNGKEVLDLVRQHEFDILMLDMTMPGISGVDLIKRVRLELPSVPVLVLSMHNEPQIAQRALRAGASGYITKDSDPEMLVAAIRKVAGGGNFIDPVLVDHLVFGRGAEERPPHELLSDREFQVIRMLAAGKNTTQIANELFLSPKTVSTHKARLMKKLDVHTTADLIRYALQYRLAG